MGEPPLLPTGTTVEGMRTDGTAIARVIDHWGAAPRVLGDAFGTVDPDAVASVVSAFCHQHLGSPVAAYEFFSGGVGTVHGVRLVDGRRVAIKAHRADVELGYLTAVQHTQAVIADAGMAAPRPLLAPTPIADGVAMVEELLDAGVAMPAHDAEQRARMAADLRRFVVLATPHRAAFGDHKGWFTGAEDTLFPAPHDRRFNLEIAGGEWIDELAARVRATLREWQGPLIVGHADWRVENLRYDAGALSAIYDWDALVVGPEAALVGQLAGIFTTDWSQADRCGIPAAEEVAAFVADYETARSRPFTAEEHELARAALVYQTAYLARCQWSDMLTGMGRHEPVAAQATLPSDGFIGRLVALAPGVA
jgi:hypothetical protein